MEEHSCYRTEITEVGKCIANDRLQSEVIRSQRMANNKTIQPGFDFHLRKPEYGNNFPVETCEGYVEKRNSERENVWETKEGDEDSYPQVTCFVRDYWVKMSTFKECCYWSKYS